MGTAAKVFAWINRIACLISIGGITLLAFIMIRIIGPLSLLYLFIIIPLLLISLLCRTLIRSVDDGDKQVWIGVLAILFIGILPGIFYLCWEPYSYRRATDQYRMYNHAQRINTNATQAYSNVPQIKTIEYVKPEYALVKIKELYEQKVLTKAQYEAKLSKYKKLI